MTTPLPDKLAFSIRETCEASGHCENKIYGAIGAGVLQARKLGRKTLILRADLEAYLSQLPKKHPKENPHAPKCRNKNPIGKRKGVAEGAAA